MAVLGRRSLLCGLRMHKSGTRRQLPLHKEDKSPEFVTLDDLAQRVAMPALGGFDLDDHRAPQGEDDQEHSQAGQCDRVRIEPSKIDQPLAILGHIGVGRCDECQSASCQRSPEYEHDQPIVVVHPSPNVDAQHVLPGNAVPDHAAAQRVDACAIESDSH